MPALRSLLCATALALTSCATAPGSAGLPADLAAAKLDPAQQRGHDFAVRRCAGCHTVGLDEGGAGDGPAFYKLARRYNPIALEHRFAQVSAHGFESMPPVEFTRAEAEDLVAYFDTLHGN